MSGEGERPSGAHGFLGPVEAGSGSSAPLPPLRPHPSVLTHRQKYLLTAVLIALGALWAAHHAAGHRPDVAANSPPPYPSQAARFGYAGPAPRGDEAFALRLEAYNLSKAPLEVLDVSQGYRGISVLVTGGLPRTVAPGQSVELLVALHVTDCSAAPADAELPFLDVTLRNTRAMETVSQILGDAYAHDLSASLHQACPNS
ncbi:MULTISPECIES: hypothetical protein [Kitasatospora]|uniref:Tat pathway signal sequence domain protein n=2 Tax=Kitasatospora TaxID=2063 RepID=A0ABT1J6E0_9ACTN|nr:hypothetical protein [Kitasatospora paracochleata]MCP2312616.1 hypothetical protein [Kitasatospora paracochleata]